MKDNTISYDLVHHHHQQQQQQQQQQPQHHSWNHQRQQQHQTHTTSVYANHGGQGNAGAGQQSAANGPQNQRSAIGSQQQQLGQYHHQQLQSTPAAHHNLAAAAAATAYYQQAHHLYPPYQAHTQEQQTQSGQQAADQHHPGSQVAATGASSSVVNAAVVAAAQQQQHSAHHQQATNNTQTPALNHAGWSPGIGSLGHHAVVTDHSTLAYMTHAYQSHNSSVGDHHRTTNGPMSTQPIGTGHQASTYGVGTMYNSPAAAAVAAYGYNNYDAAFFQTSNNGPHTQTGHPSSANISTFWNHNQTSQQRTNHPQAVNNQAAAVQQRQPIVSEQTASYMHDPRLYYGKPAAAANAVAAAYNQGLQNFGQTQHHSQAQQADVLQHRMTTLSQHQQLLHHHDQQQLHQVAAHSQQQLHHQVAAGSHHQQSTTTNQQALLNNQQQHAAPENSLSIIQTNSNLIQNQSVRQNSSPIKASPQQQAPNKQAPSNDDKTTQPIGQSRAHHDYEQSNTTTKQQSSIPASVQTATQQKVKESLSTIPQNSQSISKPSVGSRPENNSLSHNSNSAPTNSQSVIKNDVSASSQYQRKSQTMNDSQLQNRNVARSMHDDRVKVQNDAQKKISNDDELKTSTINSEKKTSSLLSSQSQDSELEDGIGSLSLGSRKTTWASIASQPAKVSQPKSLKSKIAGSNSVLSSAKHLAAVSLDTSSLESKNGINPAIKSSVSAAATSIQRNSVPPPISKVPSAVASLKLNLLGETNSESSRISWPAVNASINLTLDEPPQKETSVANPPHNDNNNSKKDDGVDRQRDFKDSLYKDHNHNQGSNSRMVNSYQPPNRDPWSRRDQPRDHREFRIRRDSDRKEHPDIDKRMNHLDEPRESRDIHQRRDFKPDRGRVNYRGDEHYRDRDFKRGAMQDRHDQRANDGYNQRFSSSRHEPRDSHHSHSHHQQNRDPHGGGRHNETQQTQHHHYNNVRDGHPRGSSVPKPDPSVHTHLNLANFNPKNFNLEPENARFFIIKSYSEDDIHRSIKYSIWCSTTHGNKRLDEAYMQQQLKNGPIYLFFSVNSSGHFCGMAQMTSAVDFESSSGVWAQNKWLGEFSVKWIYVKDVPNSSLRHITLENNEDKPVTNSRDTQEVPSEKGRAVLKIIHQYPHATSLFDDFLHYERKQEEEKFKKTHPEPSPPHRSEERERGPMGGGGGGAGGGLTGGSRFGRPYMNPHNRPHNDLPGHRERSSRFAS